MGFYDLSKVEREKLFEKMREEIRSDVKQGTKKKIHQYCGDEDTYIRKNAYLILGRAYRDEEGLQQKILTVLDRLIEEKENELLRQTAVYALCEIGKHDAQAILPRLESMIDDPHHKVRNAVVGGLKQMVNKNPEPSLAFTKKFLHHPDPRIRREIVHGIELRGRTHPEDVLPLLAEVQDDQDIKVRKTLIHVLGQISYKKGCLEKVVKALAMWKNQQIVEKAIDEILKVHEKYPFSEKTPEEAKDYIFKQL
ncbi:MAG: HEAT repeat domain-containing protein [Candidatus Heimdallarchaeota archaeon]|nr:MAG: HEAT repeat domain-containing protein [Candidatus Heimdallarchaeota archaeon]